MTVKDLLQEKPFTANFKLEEYLPALEFMYNAYLPFLDKVNPTGEVAEATEFFYNRMVDEHNSQGCPEKGSPSVLDFDLSYDEFRRFCVSLKVYVESMKLQWRLFMQEEDYENLAFINQFLIPSESMLDGLIKGSGIEINLSGYEFPSE